MWFIFSLLSLLAAGSTGLVLGARALAEAVPVAAARPAVKVTTFSDTPLQRGGKGDRLSRAMTTDPPGEVASIEILGDPSRVVLRGYAGDVAFYINSRTATTVAVKGVSIPQVKLPSSAAAAFEPRKNKAPPKGGAHAVN